MDADVSDSLHDPFSLDGKNPRRVAPAVRRNIQLQRSRVFAYTIGSCILVLVSIVSARSTWIPGILAVVCLLLLPFSLLSIYCDWRLLRWQRSRLAECERRIAEEDANHQT